MLTGSRGCHSVDCTCAQLSDARSLLPLRLRLVYNSVLYSGERIEEVLRQIEMILDDCLSNPSIAVSDISVRGPPSSTSALAPVRIIIRPTA